MSFHCNKNLRPLTKKILEHIYRLSFIFFTKYLEAGFLILLVSIMLNYACPEITTDEKRQFSFDTVLLFTVTLIVYFSYITYRILKINNSECKELPLSSFYHYYCDIRMTKIEID